MVPKFSIINVFNTGDMILHYTLNKLKALNYLWRPLFKVNEYPCLQQNNLKSFVVNIFS